MKNRKLLASPFTKIYHKSNQLTLARLLTLFILICTAVAFLNLSSSPSPSSEQTTFAINSQKHLTSANTSHREGTEQKTNAPPPPPPTCSALIHYAGGKYAGPLLCCDRSHFRTDVCYMRGDIRTTAGAAVSRQKGNTSILLHGAPLVMKVEKIRPYTRKWEKEIMSTVDEIILSPVPAVAGEGMGGCDVRHGVPGVVFSTGGYTGNVYHEFNDGLIPLYVTAERFSGEVVLLVLEYHSWWFSKYKSVLENISRYKIVNLGKEKRVHCFSELIVGLKIHGELAIDPNLMPTRKGIAGFQSMLNRAFASGTHPASTAARLPAALHHRRPKLTILVRKRSRRLLNLRDVVRLSHRVGFEAELLSPKRSIPLADIHHSLASTDAMMAVHGAALTHFLFMRPRSVLIQVVPLGLGWAAESFYGEPARRLGLQYLAYNVTPSESSLSREYSRNDPVLLDPMAVTSRGWAATKRVYLDKQDVTVNLQRFGKLLAEAHDRTACSFT